MLGHQHRDAAFGDGADHRDHVADFRGVQSGQHFIEQEQAWCDRERTCKLEPLAPRHRQRRRRSVELRGKPDRLRDLAGGGERFAAAAMRRMRTDRDVLPHGKAGKRLHDLKRSRDAAARQSIGRLSGDIGAVVDNASAIRPSESRR